MSNRNDNNSRCKAWMCFVAGVFAFCWLDPSDIYALENGITDLKIS